jgi:hypothetical protein
MPTSQSWTPKSRETIALITNSRMEVRDDHQGEKEMMQYESS